MSKNLTLKGAAFGAFVALSLATVAPASAAGLADNSFVSLAPTTGTAYTVVAGEGKTFSLTSNEASTVAGGNLKFLVSDASDVVEVANGTTGRTAFTVDQTSGNTVEAVASTDVVTIDIDASTTLAVGDYVSFANAIDANGATAGVVQAANTPVLVTAVTSTTSFAFKASANIASDVSSTTLNGTNAITTVVREARNTTDHNFVVDTGTNTASTSSTVVLQTTESTVVTRSVDVTAWVDSNGNDTLDSTEYASPTRTVKFIKGSEVTATTTVDPIIVGSTSVVARVTTTPALNGQQMSNGDVNAMFTFQGSAVEFTPATSAAVYNTTSGKWDITATRTLALATTDNVAQAATTGVVTVTAANTLTAGEKFQLSGDLANTNGTVASAGSPATEFTVASATSSAFTFVGTGTSARADATISTARTLTIRIVSGSYSARAKIGSDYLQAAATSGNAATVTSSTGKAVVSTGANVISDGADAPTATVRPDTLAVSAAWTFKDSSAVAVTAGRPVKLTVTTVTGVTGLKINGTAAAQGDVIDLTTDAAGSVSAAVTTTAAVNGNSVVLTAVAEGVSGSSKAVTFNWTTATNTLYDLNSTASVYRSIAKGGSYTFNFAVADNFKQLVAGDYRLKVVTSGNTVSETYTAIAAGTASVTVADNQISSTGDVTVVVTPQKKQTDGTWATTGAPSAVTYYLKPAAQSGAKVTAITADATADFATTAVVAGDSRTSQASVTGDGTAGTDAVEVTGVVTDALTGVVVPGAAVTISGSADLLFVDGAVAKSGSIVVYADASGAYSVHVRSNKAAVDTVVKASALGAVSSDLKITFLKAKADTGKTLTVSAPAFVKGGSTAVITVSLKDALGNAVVTDSGATGYQAGSTTPTVKVTYTGPGFVTSTIASLTDANGEVKFVVLLGANDTGSGVITAAYDSNGSTTDVVGTTLTAAATATFTIGSAPAAAVVAGVSGGTGKFNVAVTNAAGKSVVVKVAGKFVTSFKGSASKKTVAVNASKGSKKVTVYVGGKLVATKTVTVK